MGNNNINAGTSSKSVAASPHARAMLRARMPSVDDQPRASAMAPGPPAHKALNKGVDGLMRALPPWPWRWPTLKLIT